MGTIKFLSPHSPFHWHGSNHFSNMLCTPILLCTRVNHVEIYSLSYHLCICCSLPGKRPWTLYHNSWFLVYWALTRDTERLPCVNIDVCVRVVCACSSTCTQHAFQRWLRSISGLLLQKKEVLSTEGLLGRLGACHIALGTAYLGAFHSTRQNSYLGA